MAKIPTITFDESNTGFIPIRQNIRNRIAIVSKFNRGPVTPTFITGDTFFADTYGSDNSVGSLAYQVARDQGAEDFLIARVLGSAKSSKGQITFSGIASKNNVLFFNVRHIAEIVEVTPVAELITTGGIYNSSVTGKYFFKVTEVTLSVATIKYNFVPQGGSEVIDWDTVATSISVDLVADKGVAKAVDSGVELFFGQSTQTTDLALVLNDEFTLRVYSYAYPIDIRQNDIPAQMVNSFKEAVTGRDVIGDVVSTAEGNGVIFELNRTTDELIGDIGNKFSYHLSLQDTDTPGFITNPLLDTTTFMNGGEEGPRQSFVDFYTINDIPILRLQSIHAGSFSNNIRVTLYPEPNLKYRLLVTDLSASNYNPKLKTETYYFDFLNTDNRGVIEALNASNYIRGIFLPKFNDEQFDINLISQAPVRLAPANPLVTDVEDIAHPDYYGPGKLINVPLENGYDGPEITNDDYVRTINSLENYPVNIVCCPGIYSNTTIEQALIAHAEKESDKDGLRIAILNARPGLLPNAARQETLGLDSKRAVKVVGWGTYIGQRNSPRFSISPDIIMAGKLGFIPFYASPHARRTSGPIRGIAEVDTKLTSSKQALQLYSDARLEVIQVDPATQTFLFTNGNSLSTDEAWRRITVRRTYDVIRQDVYNMLTNYIGEPHTNLARAQIESSITAYLQELLRQGQIANFKDVICNSSNNPPELYVTGTVNVNFSFLPIFPIDYINVSIIRSSEDGLISNVGI
jgi:hypothetical protein